MVESAPRLRADARRNREQVVAAAREVFIEQGADAPLEEIARRAGVGIATLYRRFPDRYALIRAIALDNMAIFIEELDRAEAEEPGAWDALARFLRVVVQRRISTLIPLVAPSLGEELRAHGEVWARRERVLARVRRLLRAAQREGTLREDIGTGDIAVGLLKVSRPVPAISSDLNERATGRQLELFLDGLRAAPSSGSRLRGEPLTMADLDQHLGLSP